MHERKAEMAREADAFIALPGSDSELQYLIQFTSVFPIKGTVIELIDFRWIRDNGRAIGNDNMVTTWNSQKTCNSTTLVLKNL